MNYIKEYYKLNEKIYGNKIQLKNNYNDIYTLEILNAISFGIFNKNIKEKIINYVDIIKQNTLKLFDLVDKRELLIKKHKDLLNYKHNVIMDDYLTIYIIDPEFENIHLKYEFENQLKNLLKKYDNCVPNNMYSIN